MTDGRKIQVFSGLLEKEALSWFLGTKFHLWKELEEEFLQTWCVVMTSTNAIVDVQRSFKRKTNIFGYMLLTLRNTEDFLWRRLLKRQSLPCS